MTATGVDVRLEILDEPATRSAIAGLAGLLVDAVEGGASVNFLAGLSAEDAAEWWASRLPLVADGTVSPIVARDHDDRVVGVVLLVRSTKQNGPHRADIEKLLVRRDARERGIGRALLEEAEALAAAEGRWLLILDTVAGSAADRLYRAGGWIPAGTIPDYALDTAGRPEAATFFWKDLRAGSSDRP
jgi:GNAT superfamily N-acetyltransferase